MELPMTRCQISASQLRSWDELPLELVQVVASRLTVYRDYIRLRAVCVSWRSTLPRLPSNNQIPWLMLPCCSSSSGLSFFDVTENKFHLINLPAECNGNRVCGTGASSLGWLLMMGEDAGPKVVNLYNPFTGILIPLPPFTTLPQHIDLLVFNEELDYFSIDVAESERRCCSLKIVHKFFVSKMVLSTNPSLEENGDDYMVGALLCYGGLAFMKKGDKAWSLYFDYEFDIIDVIFHKGQFYVLSYCGLVGVLDFNSNGSDDSPPPPPPKLTIISSYFRLREQGDKKYLVEDSSGSLLLVARRIRCLRKGHQETSSFNVFKLVQTGSEQDEWVCNEVNSIGGDALFLGPNSSVCLSSEDCGCQRNCIYFADTPDNWIDSSTSRVHDLGVFDLEDGSIKPFIQLHEQHPKECLNHQMPTWVTPNPRSN